MKLITTDAYLLLIDEEVEIKLGDKNITAVCFDFDDPYVFTSEIIKEEDVEHAHNKVIAYYPLKEAKELDLPLLPNPFEEEVHVEKLAKDRATILFSEGESSANWRGCVEDFMVGYKAAQSKQFSLEDMRKAIEMGREYDVDKAMRLELAFKYSEEEIIQSLSTQKLPKEFIPIDYYVCANCLEDKNNPNYKGCHGNYGNIRLFKTITNSEGKQELIGTYKW